MKQYKLDQTTQIGDKNWKVQIDLSEYIGQGLVSKKTINLPGGIKVLIDISVVPDKQEDILTMAAATLPEDFSEVSG